MNFLYLNWCSLCCSVTHWVVSGTLEAVFRIILRIGHLWPRRLVLFGIKKIADICRISHPLRCGRSDKSKYNASDLLVIGCWNHIWFFVTFVLSLDSGSLFIVKCYPFDIILPAHKPKFTIVQVYLHAWTFSFHFCWKPNCWKIFLLLTFFYLQLFTTLWLLQMKLMLGKKITEISWKSDNKNEGTQKGI